MASKEKTVLGIDIDEHELRVVQVKARGGKTVIVDALSAPLPSGSVFNGVVRQPGNVAVALNRLLDNHKISCRRAVLGMCSESSFLKMVSVPPVPEEELPVVVAGEVNHFHVIRSRNGVYAFFPLSESSDAAKPTAHVALYGAEEDSPRGLRDLGDRVGLDIVSIEPTSLALLRLCMLEPAAKGNVLVVMIENTTTDLAYVRKGKVAFIRRLDIGARTMLPEDASVREMAMSGSGADEHSEGMTDRIIEDLALDVRRSIEYLGREYREDGQVDQVLVAVRHVGGAELVTKLQEEVAAPIAHVPIPTSMTGRDRVSNRFSGALGLALRDAPDAAGLVPNIDLFSIERAQYQLQSKKRNVAGSFFVSGIALLGGLLGFVMFGRTAAGIEVENEKTQAKLVALQKQVEEQENEAGRVLEGRKQLEMISVPTDLTIDAVAQSLRPNVHLESLKISGPKADLLLTARSEGEMISTVDRMSVNPMLKQVAFGSFQRDPKTAALKFNVTAQARSLAELETTK